MNLIVTPYDRSETAQAAVRLADLIESTGGRVVIAALGAPEKGIHLHWDRLVRSAAPGKLDKLAPPCETAICFTTSNRVANTIASVARKARRLLIHRPRHDGPLTGREPYFLHYHNVICPTHSSCMKLLGGVHTLFGPFVSGAIAKRTTWCRWDAGVDRLPRDGAAEGLSTPTLGIWVDHSIRRASLQVSLLKVILHIRRVVPKTRIRMLGVSRLPARVRRALRSCGAIETVLVPSLPEQLVEFRRCDWLLIHSVTSSFGYPIQQANSAGVPVIAFDANPWAELIDHGKNGYLVPSVAQPGRQGTISADAEAELVVQVLSSPQKLLAMQQGADGWGVELDRRQFTRFWSVSLDLDCG